VNVPLVRVMYLICEVQFDSMSEPRHRKLAAMGMAALVSTGRPEVLRRLPTEIFNLWGDVFAEIKEVQNSIADEQSEYVLCVTFNSERPVDGCGSIFVGSLRAHLAASSVTGNRMNLP
jgi:hypothetical protein